MSSATSTKSESVHARDSAAGRRASHDPHTTAYHSPPATPADDSALRPWQFFLLAGMLCATAVVIVATGQSAASIVILSLTVVAASLVALGAHRALAPLVLPVGALEASTLIAGRSRAGLEREKTLVLRTIKELEFDFAMGKISRSDYDEMGGRLRARAIGLIRQLDAGDGYKGAIEQELQIRMGTGGTNQPPLKLRRSAEALAKAEVPPSTPVIAHPALSTIDESDASITQGSGGATSVAPMPRATASPCVSCGLSNDPDARFCKHCGTKLTA